MKQTPEYYFSANKLKLLPMKQQSLGFQTRSHYIRQETSNDQRPLQLKVGMNFDKETLFEELQRTKKQINEQELLIKSLKTSNTYLKSELNRYQSTSTLPDVFTTQLKNSVRTRSDQLSKLQNQLQTKDKLIEKLKQDVRSGLLEEYEAQVSALSLENQNLELKLQRALQIGDQESNIKRDNIDMALIIKQQEIAISNLNQKLFDIQRRFTSLQFKYRGLKMLQEKQYQELKIIRERDTLFQEHQNSRHQKEKQLKEQLDQISAEMNITNANYTTTQNRLNATEKKLKDVTSELTDQIKSLESEIQRYRAQIQQLRDELDVEKTHKHRRMSTLLSGFQMVVDDVNRSIKKSPQNLSPNRKGSQLDRIFEENLQNNGTQRMKSDHHSNRKLDKNFLAQLSRQIKYKLISKRIDLKDIDQVLTNLYECISSVGIFPTKKSQPQQTQKYACLIQFLACKMNMKYPPWHNICLTSMRANQQQVHLDIFKTLMENYQLPKPEEVPQIEKQIKQVIQKKREELITYIQQKHKQPYPEMLVDDLLEAIKAHDCPFNQFHINHLLAYLCMSRGDIQYFYESDFDDLFTIEMKALPEDNPFEGESPSPRSNEINPFEQSPNIENPLDEDMFKMVDSSGMLD